MSRITVVGSFSMDLTVTMSQFPKEGQTIIGKKMLKNPGGKGANQCIAAARLGGDVEMIGMVGNDENGRIIKDLFASEGVNIEHVLTTDKEPTTIALIEIDDTAQNKIVVVPAANFVYSVEDLHAVKDVIANTEMVVAQLEMRLDVMEELAKNGISMDAMKDKSYIRQYTWDKLLIAPVPYDAMHVFRNAIFKIKII